MPSTVRSAMPTKPRVVMLLGACIIALAIGSTDATAADRAVIEVQSLSASLLKSMRAGRSESMTERYRDLKPVIDEVFALPLMTRLSVGPSWARFSPQQQQALVKAFSRFTIANYAHNFRSFDGEKFQVDEKVVRRGPEEVVRAQLIPANDTPANLLYLMEKVDGLWRVVDVYYNGISQLALHRADFASAIGSGGAPVLIAHLNKVSDDLMK
jgi:phospholipid transport system substrate-binding protein